MIYRFFSAISSFWEISQKVTRQECGIGSLSDDSLLYLWKNVVTRCERKRCHDSSHGYTCSEHCCTWTNVFINCTRAASTPSGHSKGNQRLGITSFAGRSLRGNRRKANILAALAEIERWRWLCAFKTLFVAYTLVLMWQKRKHKRHTNNKRKITLLKMLEVCSGWSSGWRCFVTIKCS